VAADAADEKTTTLPVASLSPFISQKSQNIGLPEKSSQVVIICQKKKKKKKYRPRGIRIQQFTNRF
jgi:hypothetical protein